VLRVSTTHYNSERRHRGLALPPPDPARAANPPPVGKIERRDRQGGLIHEYRASSVNPGFETLTRAGGSGPKTGRAATRGSPSPSPPSNGKHLDWPRCG
jgi:hypothetical protein